jgi:chromosome partitioning protein
MEIVVFTSIKGGVGKTSIALAVADVLARRFPIALVDLDANGNASAALGIQDPHAGAAFLDVLASGSDPTPLVRETGISGLSILPNSGHFASVDRALSGIPGAETLLRESLAHWTDGRFGAVILDTPPTLGLPLLIALSAAKRAVAIIEARAASLGAVSRVLDAVDAVRRRLNPALTLAGIAVNRLDGRNRHSRDVLDWIRTTYGPAVLSPSIRETIRVSEAFSHGQPVTQYAPKSTAAQDLEALTFALFPDDERKSSHGKATR